MVSQKQLLFNSLGRAISKQFEVYIFTVEKWFTTIKYSGLNQLQENIKHQL